MTNFFLNLWEKQFFLSLAGLKISFLALAIVFSLVFWLFKSWQNLRQDYEEEEIIIFSIISIFIFFLFSKLGFVLLNLNSLVSGANQLSLKITADFAPWFGFLGFLLFVYFFSKKYNWFFFDVLEKLTFTLMGIFFLIFLADFISYPRLFSVASILIIVAVWLAAANYFKNYRSFSWYPSGKAGFLFLVTLGTFSLLHSLVKIFIPALGVIEPITGLLTTIFCLFTIYLLAKDR